MFLRFIFLLCMGAPFFLMAQEEGQEILSHFSISQSGDAIRLVLTIEAGTSSCNGIELERSTGGEYQTIALIPGICGGSEFEETYILLDENPVPGIEASYRVNLGNVGRSSILKITFVELRGGVAVIPNPGTGPVRVITSEELTDADISVFDAQGNKVKILSNVSVPGDIMLDTLEPGVYVLVVEGNGKSWTARLVIGE